MGFIKQNRWVAIGVVCYGLFLFTLGLGHQEVIGFESRFYLFILEMWRHGPSLFPTTYNHPYPDYPVTSTFLSYLVSKTFGELDKLTAIFPSALASALTLALVYLIGAHYNKRWGLAAVFFLLMTNAYVTEARTISLDQYTTLITTLCFYVVLRGKNIFFWFFPLIVLGFAMRGPIGLIIPTGVVCVYFLLEKNLKQFFIAGVGALILLIACSLVMLGLAYHVGGASFAHDVLQMQVLGRIQGAKPLPWYFYLIESFGAYAIAYPLAILVLLGMQKVAPENKKFLIKLLGWGLVILLGMSVPSDKKVRYILPFAPALALICGYLVVANRGKYFYFLQRSIYGLLFIFPGLSLILFLFVRNKHPEFNLSYVLQSFFVLMQILTLLVVMFLKERKMATFFIASLSFVITFAFIVEPINLQLNETRQFVLQAEKLRLQQKDLLVFYHQGTDGLVIKYMANSPQETQPIFINEADELIKFGPPAFFVASEEDYKKLPKDVLESTQVKLRGNLGREPFVVFVKDRS